jgi:hypothetical protein
VHVRGEVVRVVVDGVDEQILVGAAGAGELELEPLELAHPDLVGQGRQLDGGHLRDVTLGDVRGGVVGAETCGAPGLGELADIDPVVVDLPVGQDVLQPGHVGQRHLADVDREVVRQDRAVEDDRHD